MSYHDYNPGSRRPWSSNDYVNPYEEYRKKEDLQKGFYKKIRKALGEIPCAQKSETIDPSSIILSSSEVDESLSFLGQDLPVILIDNNNPEQSTTKIYKGNLGYGLYFESSMILSNEVIEDYFVESIHLPLPKKNILGQCFYVNGEDIYSSCNGIMPRKKFPIGKQDAAIYPLLIDLRNESPIITSIRLSDGDLEELFDGKGRLKDQERIRQIEKKRLESSNRNGEEEDWAPAVAKQKSYVPYENPNQLHIGDCYVDNKGKFILGHPPVNQKSSYQQGFNPALVGYEERYVFSEKPKRQQSNQKKASAKSIAHSRSRGSKEERKDSRLEYQKPSRKR